MRPNIDFHHISAIELSPIKLLTRADGSPFATRNITLIEVIPDGSRFAGKCMLGRVGQLECGKMVYGVPTAHGLRIVVENEPSKVTN